MKFHAHPNPLNQARRMSQLEWCWMLMRGPDYEGGWIQYLKVYG